MKPTIIIDVYVKKDRKKAIVILQTKKAKKEFKNSQKKALESLYDNDTKFKIDIVHVKLIKKWAEVHKLNFKTNVKLK